MQSHAILHSYLAISFASTRLSEEEKELLKREEIAAIVLFTRNIESLTQLQALVTEARKIKPNLIMMIDHEGIDLELTNRGIRSGVWRAFYKDTDGSMKLIPGFPAPPSQYCVAHSSNPEQQAFEHGKTIAQTLAPLGIIPLATVLDSNDDDLAPYPKPNVKAGITKQSVTDASPGAYQDIPKQGVLSKSDTEHSDSASLANGWVVRGLGRSFGQNHIIAKLAREKLKGLRSVLQCPTVVKHFPDHGRAQDSHDAHCVVDTSSMDTLNRHIKQTYATLSDEGLVDIVMTNHIRYSHSPEPHTEAGLSAYWLDRLLKIVKDNTLIISDCLGMGAIQAKGISLAEAISIASKPCESMPNTLTHLVLVCNQEGHYPELLKQLEHCAHPDATRRLKRIQIWTESVSNKHLKKKIQTHTRMN